MASESNSNILDSIFAETHSELESLNYEMSKLKDVYLTDDISDEESDKETNEFEISNKTSSESLFVYVDNFFSADQIEHFHQIFIHYPMRKVIEDEKTREKRLDKRDDDAFLTRLQESCCTKKCLLKVNHQAALRRYQEMKAMTQNESNLCFLGIIDASMHVAEFKNGTPKAYLTTNYKFEGITICQKAWYTIYDIQKRRWEALRTHYQRFGLTPKIHGSTGRVSHHAISFSTTLNVLKFIANFANQHGLPSPGRSFRDNTHEITYLPACESKRSLYRIYDNLEHDGINEVSLSSFQRIWNQYLPGIQFMTARSDLCILCKKKWFGAQYWNTNETLQKLNEWTSHYNRACLERENYRSKIAVNSLTNFSRPGIPNSVDIENHVSWDFAENVHIPYSSQQEGAVYFKSLYKVEVFGICEEAVPRQINYLIPEHQSIGKGPNTVVSLVHHYFATHGLGEKHVIIHADNCVGQNKNNTMIKYLCWRVMNGLHDKITYSFMVPGHTKFGPDSFFGLFKLKLRNSEVDDLEDLMHIVEQSTTGEYNKADTVINSYGNRKIIFYNWNQFLDQFFTTVPSILMQHHFVISCEHPGKVKIRKSFNSDETEISIARVSSIPKKKNGELILPDTIIPNGISLERQWYLHDEISQHIQNPEKREIYCKVPDQPKPKKLKNTKT